MSLDPDAECVLALIAGGPDRPPVQSSHQGSFRGGASKVASANVVAFSSSAARLYPPVPSHGLEGPAHRQANEIKHDGFRVIARKVQDG
jgi:hypothetical protein